CCSATCSESDCRLSGNERPPAGRTAMASVTELKTPAGEPKDLYDLGEVPPLGHVPAKMHAWAIRKERHGPPESSMRIEVVPTWRIGDDEGLVYVMAGGGNYNRVGGGPRRPAPPRGVPKKPHHIA